MFHALANSIVEHETGLSEEQIRSLVVHSGALCRAISDENVVRVMREMALIQRTLPKEVADIYFPVKKLNGRGQEQHSGPDAQGTNLA